MIFPILSSLTPEARAELDAHIEAKIAEAIGERVLLTVSEFAQKSGLSQKSIRHRIERGQLQVVRHGGRLLIPSTELGLG